MIKGALKQKTRGIRRDTNVQKKMKQTLPVDGKESHDLGEASHQPQHQDNHVFLVVVHPNPSRLLVFQ